MAEKRMFAKSIIDTDTFLSMPLSAQALYFHLNMRADDDGFVSSPRKIQRMICCSDDDMKLLIAKRYILVFESGVIVIKHWKIHNYIRKDTYHETLYMEEKSSLFEKPDGAYTDHPLIEPSRTRDESVTDPSTQYRLDKSRLGKVSKEENIGANSEDSPPPEPPIIELILNDKSQFPITQNKIDEWKELYPAVDVMQELRKMKGWLNSNPTKRKTKRGILRFANSWLAKEQDRGGSKGYVGKTNRSGKDEYLP